MAIDANTGKVINAARVKVGETMTNISSPTNAQASHVVMPTEEGIVVKTTTPAVVTLYDVQGKVLATRKVNAEAQILTSHKGLMLVKITDAHSSEVHKVIR